MRPKIINLESPHAHIGHPMLVLDTRRRPIEEVFPEIAGSVIFADTIDEVGVTLIRQVRREGFWGRLWRLLNMDIRDSFREIARAWRDR